MTVERRVMLGPREDHYDNRQYQYALQLSADWRMKYIDFDGFGYGRVGGKAFYEWKGHLSRLPSPEYVGAQQKQDAQMSVVKHVADGEWTGAAWHVAFAYPARLFTYWPINQAAESLVTSLCPRGKEPGAHIQDVHFEGFLYMSRGLPWESSDPAEYLKILNASIENVILKPRREREEAYFELVRLRDLRDALLKTDIHLLPPSIQEILNTVK